MGGPSGSGYTAYMEEWVLFGELNTHTQALVVGGPLRSWHCVLLSLTAHYVSCLLMYLQLLRIVSSGH